MKRRSAVGNRVSGGGYESPKFNANPLLTWWQSTIASFTIVVLIFNPYHHNIHTATITIITITIVITIIIITIIIVVVVTTVIIIIITRRTERCIGNYSMAGVITGWSFQHAAPNSSSHSLLSMFFPPLHSSSSSVHPSNHPCIHLIIRASIQSFVHPCTHTPIHPSNHSCIHPPIRSSIHPSIPLANQKGVAGIPSIW